MTTATQIIGQALGIIGVKAPGQPLGNEAADCLERLNMMLDGMRTENLFASASIRVSATINGGAQTATIGPLGDFAITPRPIAILSGSFYTVGSVDYPIEPISAAEYNEIALKDTQTLGPAWVYHEAGDPLGTLYFWPLLSGQAVVTLLVAGHPSEFADLTTDYTLEPGAKRMLAYTFAEEMSADFERAVPPPAQKIAANARRSLKRSHHVVPQLANFSADTLSIASLSSAAARFQSAYADYYADNYA